MGCRASRSGGGSGGQVTRRAAVSIFTCIGVCLGGNLGNSTTRLLCAAPQSVKAAARQVRVDVVVPMCLDEGAGGGDEKQLLTYKRFFDQGSGAEFVYPSSWLADVTIARRRAESQAERTSLDFPQPSRASVARRAGASTLPLVAFGPQNSSGELNISLVEQPLGESGSASDIVNRGGENADSFARALLDAIVRRGTEPKTYELLDAKRTPSGQLEMEYIVRTESWQRHNLSTAMAAPRNNSLLTLSAQIPEASWERDRQLREQVRATLASLRVAGD